MSSALSVFLSHCATTFPGKTLRWHQLLKCFFIDAIFIDSLYNLLFEDDYKVYCLVY